MKKSDCVAVNENARARDRLKLTGDVIIEKKGYEVIKA